MGVIVSSHAMNRDWDARINPRWGVKVSVLYTTCCLVTLVEFTLSQSMSLALHSAILDSVIPQMHPASDGAAPAS